MRHPLRQTGHAQQFETPLKRIRGLGTAREGTEHFIRQRLTGLANAILVVVLAVIGIALSGKTYPEAVEMVGSVWVAVPLALAFISVAIHMKLGVQVVIEDYIQNEGARVLLSLLNTFFAVAVAAAALFAIVRIMLAALAAGA
ncbi:succinate dehydrogenase, hydrophobic membrane anchor protein [Acuticoccus sp. M5D2P5]|uniref:succinate dehydrogenase, hydrophobic membrane anchor protein n=1 Tax=Acuticoccus kalidii TaxID=2910977 RepID=UPI001F1ECEFD|nr:succinate dehydrogenase, hydrophobic membrane anchor protein [Acuticoccus kalidii]MCF3935902.1 succinate dehydrogenase, hydrophobic membrane anchor protein [Acuticoccus kalidii]